MAAKSPVGHKVDVRVLLGFLFHVGLMAVGVGDDQVAALADKVLGCVGGDAALSDLVLQTIWSSLMPSSAAASLMPLMCAAL